MLRSSTAAARTAADACDATQITVLPLPQQQSQLELMLQLPRCCLAAASAAAAFAQLGLRLLTPWQFLLSLLLRLPLL